MDQALASRDRVAAAIVLGQTLRAAGARNARMERWVAALESSANDNV